MSINDLEKNKFILSEGNVVLNITSFLEGLDDIGNKNINDLEESKFETNGSIRIITTI